MKQSIELKDNIDTLTQPLEMVLNCAHWKMELHFSFVYLSQLTNHWYSICNKQNLKYFIPIVELAYCTIIESLHRGDLIHIWVIQICTFITVTVFFCIDNFKQFITVFTKLWHSLLLENGNVNVIGYNISNRCELMSIKG